MSVLLSLVLVYVQPVKVATKTLFMGGPGVCDTDLAFESKSGGKIKDKLGGPSCDGDDVATTLPTTSSEGWKIFSSSGEKRTCELMLTWISSRLHSSREGERVLTLELRSTKSKQIN